MQLHTLQKMKTDFDSFMNTVTVAGTKHQGMAIIFMQSWALKVEALIEKEIERVSTLKAADHVVPESALLDLSASIDLYRHYPDEHREIMRSELGNYFYDMREHIFAMADYLNDRTANVWKPIGYERMENAMVVTKGFCSKESSTHYYGLGAFDNDGHLTTLGHNGGDRKYIPVYYQLFRR